MRYTQFFRFVARTLPVLVCAGVAGLALASSPIAPLFGVGRDYPQAREFFVERRLAKPVTLEVVEVPFLDVVRMLAERTGVQIKIDNRATDDVGLDCANTLITKDLPGFPLREVLDILLRELDLVYTIEDHYVLITTPEAVGPARIPRLYPVADLLGEKESTDSLVKLVAAALHRDKEAVREEAVDVIWSRDPVLRDEEGAKEETNDEIRSRIAVFRGFLFLRASCSEHEQVRRLFSELRIRLGLEAPAPCHSLWDVARTTRLSLYYAAVDDDDLAYLKDATSLECLDLGGTRVTDGGVVRLRSLPKLQQLSLAGTRVSDHCLEHLAALTNLDYLDLSYTRIAGKELQHLQSLSKLECLRLSGTEVRDMEPLALLPALRRLHLAGTRVDDHAAESLAKIGSLEELDLRDVPITDAAMEHLAQLKKLRVLNLGERDWMVEGGDRGRISFEAAKRFKEALPDCRVIGMPPEYPVVVPPLPPGDPFGSVCPEHRQFVRPADPFRDD